MPSSGGSSQPRDRTQASRIAGRFFTIWDTREAHEYWSGQPIPSPGDLPDAGIELRYPALQADSLPAELPGKQSGYTHNWLTLLYPWNEHNTVNQLYSKFKKKRKYNSIAPKRFISLGITKYWSPPSVLTVSQ